jgi:hypothetical protein
MRTPQLRTSAAAIVVVLSGLLAGCTGDDDDRTVQQVADDALTGRAGVVRVVTSESASAGTVDVAVLMSDDATADQAADVAHRARKLAETHRDRAITRWTSQVYVGDPGSARIQVEVSPVVDDSASQDVRTAFALAAVPGVTRASFAGGTPYVEVGEVASVAAVVRELRSGSLWDEGGSVQAGDGRLRLMDEPSRVTGAQLETIARAAAEHPDGRFALEASATGERYPELFVDGVTSGQATDLVRAFTDPSLVSDNAEGYELDFTTRAHGATDPNATVDSGGTFGRPS